MASSFSRTKRSLNTDSSHTLLVWMVVVILVLAAWCLWFFTARVTIYKISSKARLITNEIVISEFSGKARRAEKKRIYAVEAEFSSEETGNIKPGQAATLYLNGDAGKKAGPIPATVENITSLPGKKHGQVRLSALFRGDSSDFVRDAETGQVKVAVEYVSPAVLVMRTSGLFADMPPVSLSPGEDNEQ